MKTSFVLAVFVLLFSLNSSEQSYTPTIETGGCLIKLDPKLVSRCGFLVVPENREKPGGRKVKIPFVFVRKPDADPVRNVILSTTGGPGYSTIANIDSIRFNSGWLSYGGFIAMDQRGTKKAQPCLDCSGIDEAIREAYTRNLSRDSLIREAVSRCRETLAAQGIDLSAFNTIESAHDIEDLRLALGLDSLILSGISYSGGLMLTVARNHPAAVKAILLNSPLPGFVNYEEDGLMNINEALDQVFENCEKDSLDPAYAGIRDRFHQYFTSIRNKDYYISYQEPGKQEHYQIRYGHNELLDAIVDRINTDQLSTVPFVMNELINGKHEQYIREVLDGKFRGNHALSYGMRLSMYCTEQIAYSDPQLIRNQDKLVPWLAGYRFNNVDHPICDCWKTRPEPRAAKDPVFSNVPVLIGGGDADPWCRPFYYRYIKRFMPNAQLLIMHNQGHAVRFTVHGTDYVKLFIDDPHSKIKVQTKDVQVE